MGDLINLSKERHKRTKKYNLASNLAWHPELESAKYLQRSADSAFNLLCKSLKTSHYRYKLVGIHNKYTSSNLLVSTLSELDKASLTNDYERRRWIINQLISLDRHSSIQQDLESDIVDVFLFTSRLHQKYSNILDLSYFDRYLKRLYECLQRVEECSFLINK